jgi:ADP-heptose:LPS heptosyltransferase
LIKKMERSGKRLLIKLVCGVVRTDKRPVEDILTNPPGKVLIVRQHHQMGDMLVAVPAFRAIKETWDGVEIGVVASTVNREVLLNSPYVDTVVAYNNRDPVSLIRLLRTVRRKRYDMVIVLHTISFSFTSALLGLLSRARIRVGSTSQPFGNPLSGAFYHVELPLPPLEERERMNEAEHNLYPLRTLGIDTANLCPEFVPTEDNEKWAVAFLADNTGGDRPAIVVHPGAGKMENIWAAENFAAVVSRLADERPLDVLVLEGPRDAETVARFARAVGVPCAVISARPIGDVAAVLRRAALVLCNDTGIMHVSTAVGAKTLALFGPTDPVRWSPPCPNLHTIRAEGGNLSHLGPGPVYEKAHSLLDPVDVT